MRVGVASVIVARLMPRLWLLPRTIERPACECGKESSGLPKRAAPRSHRRRFVVRGLFILLFCSCALAPGSFESRHAGDLAARNIKRLAIFPVEHVSFADKSKSPYSPVPAGGGNVDEGGPSVLDNLLYSTMSALPVWQIVSDREVREAMARVPPGTESSQARELGTLVYADAVIFPKLLRYHQRVGEDLGVKSPASVAFVLDLWDVKRGDLVWSARFDETQRSLTENLPALGEYFHRGVKWLKAEELAQDGIDKAVQDLRQNLYRGRS